MTGRSVVPPGVAAVGGAGDDVVGEAAAEGADAAEVNFDDRDDVHAAEDEAMTLVVNCGTVLLVLGEVGVVGVLAGGVGIDVVEGVGPGVAGKHLETAGEAMRDVQVERVVVKIAVIHVGLDHAIGRHRTGVLAAGRRFHRCARRSRPNKDGCSWLPVRCVFDSVPCG